MILIAHRGNIHGPNKLNENKPDYILETIKLGYDCEIDVWKIDSNFFLGHDKPDYEIELHFLFINSSKLWIHCKNTQALDYLIQFKELNIFWHEEDHYTITSKGVLWAHPKSIMTVNTIIVMPEHKNNQYDFTKCLGICTDYINNFT